MSNIYIKFIVIKNNSLLPIFLSPSIYFHLFTWLSQYLSFCSNLFVLLLSFSVLGGICWLTTMEFENSSPSLHTTQAHICMCPIILFLIYSVEFSRSVVSDSLWPHGLQHTRLPCPSPTPGACANLCPSNWWCHPTISFSFVPFSSYLQSFPASGSFQYINCIIWVRSVFTT